jgi:two-component system, LytTR family, sensor kinase
VLNRFLSRNLWFFYLVFWMAVAAIQFTLLVRNYNIPIWLSAADSLVFCFIYGVIGSGLWFMVQFSGRQQRNWLETVSFHLAGLAFTMLIWLGLSTFIVKSIAGANPAYIEFLDQSITFRILAGILIYFLQLTVFYLLLNVKELREQMEREASLTSMLREAELNKLRAQIKPHFLFNSLNSISSLTLSDPMKAQEMVIKLSEFMRYSLSIAEEAMSSLKNELYHAGLYLDIEKVRFSDRLLVVEEIDHACDNWPIPAMILQPLLENAVKHGVYTMTGQSSISLKVTCDKEFLVIHITNSFDPDSAPRKGTGTGLQNVIKRLAAIYNRHDLINIQKSEATFAVLLKIPGKS